MNRRMIGVMEGEFVVFLIGMRVNRWWLPHRWMPVVGAMGRMLRELHAHPELGFWAQSRGSRGRRSWSRTGARWIG